MASSKEVSRTTVVILVLAAFVLSITSTVLLLQSSGDSQVTSDTSLSSSLEQLADQEEGNSQASVSFTYLGALNNT